MIIIAINPINIETICFFDNFSINITAEKIAAATITPPLVDGNIITLGKTPAR